MTITFTGDVAFKQRLFRVLEKNELSGVSPYSIKFATSASRSAWSFGWLQHDLGTAFAQALFRDILEQATNAVGTFLIQDGDPNTGRSNDRLIATLVAAARQRSAVSLSPADEQLVNSALASTYGVNRIDGVVDSSFQNLIDRANQVAALTTGSDRAFLQSDFGKLFLCDYHNQYSITPRGPLERFVTGNQVAVFGNVVQKQGDLGVDDLLNFYIRLEQAHKTPWDPLRRFANIATEMAYTPSSQEAVGLFRASTFFVVPRLDILTATPGHQAALNAFVTAVLDPAKSLLIDDVRARYPALANVPMEFDSRAILIDPVYSTQDPENSAILNARRWTSGTELAVNNLIVGDGGDDFLTGGKGNDILVGGDGYDFYFWRDGDGNDHIEDSDRRGRLIINDQDEGNIFSDAVFIRIAGQNTWKSLGDRLTLTHSSPWTLVTPDGSTINLGECPANHEMRACMS